MIKKILSIVLCLVIVLTCVPAMPVAAGEAAQKTVRIEAENAYWNGYQKNTDSSFSGGAKLNNASGTYAAWSDLAAGKLNKDNGIYVAYTVDVPETSTYQVSVGAKIRMKAASSPYAAVLVNPLAGAETVAYQIPYGGQVGTDAVYLNSQKVDIQLQKGRNVIYMLPFTGNQNINWADTDYLEISGDYAVTHIAPAQQSVAANAGFYYLFSTVSSAALAGSNFTAADAANLSAESITVSDVSKLAHASYTVQAPADGYYDITLHFGSSGSHNTADYGFALLVDDRTAEIKPITVVSGAADVSTYLTKGVHTLTIPVMLPISDEKASSCGMYWTDLKGLTLYGGLKQAQYQESPMHTGNVLEAERDAFLWRYPSTDNNEGNIAIGGSQPGTVKQSYSELAGGAKLDKNQPMLTYYVDVETTGTYTMNASFRGYTGSDYYMIVSVDDVNYYKAGINGTDPSRKNRWLATAQLELTAGRHYIRLITLPDDSDASWINVDYAEFAGPGSVAAMNDWQHLQSGNADYIHGFTNTNYTGHASLGSQWQNALSGYQGNSMADEAGITAENFTPADLDSLGWYSYTLNVPADGYYDLQTYLHPDHDSSGTGKILMGIENANANLINQSQGVLALTYEGDHSGWMDIDGSYKAISVTAKNYLPMDQSADTDGNIGYSMVLRIGLDNGKFYAFRIINDKSVRYGYSRYGAEGSSSGWEGWAWIDQKDAAATDLIGGAGAQFKLARTAADTLTITLNGTVMDTYTMEGVTADNKVVSVGFKQFGNPVSDDYVVEVPFTVTPTAEPVSIQIADMEYGSVAADKTSYYVGDTVTLTVTPNTGYCQKIYINGEPLMLDWKTNTYFFVATEKAYNITGSFEPSFGESPSDAARWDSSNQAHSILTTYYPNNDNSWWYKIDGDYTSLAVTAKNYLPQDSSAEGDGNIGYSTVLAATLDNGNTYAFRIINEKDSSTGEIRYIYTRFGASGSVTGWGGWCQLEAKAPGVTEKLQGNGAEFKLTRTSANTLQVTLDGVVLDTYTMDGVTDSNQVTSVGIYHYGNKGKIVEIPFTLVKADETDAVSSGASDSASDAVAAEAEAGTGETVTINIAAMTNGTVTTEMLSYKVGDIVELRVTPNDGYSQKLTINGEPILLDWKTGKYSFVAAENTYEIAGGFEKNLWSNGKYKWIDVRIDGGAKQWWIADLSCYLTKGEYMILVSGLMDYTGNSYDRCDMGALTVSGGITASGTAVDPITRLNPSVSQWSIVLGDRIGVKFFFKNLLSSDAVAFYHSDELLDSEKSADSTYIVYIDPAQMTDEITVQVNGQPLSRTYSVRTYANEILAGSYGENTKNLVREMLNYGGASQRYFQYHTERLANAELNVGTRDLSTLLPLSATEFVFEDNMKGVSFYGASLLFRERIAVRFYFSGDTTGCTFQVGDQTVIPMVFNDLTCVEVANITPQQFNDAIQVTVTRNTENITVQYSPMNYLDRMYPRSTTSIELKNVLSAVYYYHQAAVSYQHTLTYVSDPNDLFYRNDNLTNFPDPFVLDNTARDGYYYIYGTWGAIRCFRSRNLMDWEVRGEVLQKWREDNKVWDNTKKQYSYQLLAEDLWAPEIVYDPDTELYYMFFSATPDLQNQAATGATTQVLMVATCSTPDGDFTPVNFKDSNSCGTDNVHSYSTGIYSDYFAKYLFLDPAKNLEFSLKINNGENRAADNGGYIANIDAHPFVDTDGTKYLFWVDSRGPDRICGVEMENWLKPKWETATALLYHDYYTVDDWKNSSTNIVSYEHNVTTTNEGPFVIEHNGKYYMTYSAGNWKYNTYLVAQAVSDSILGPYTKLKESEGGVILSGSRQGGQESSGTGHHSFVAAGDQLFIIYHRHNDPTVGGGARNHAIDEVKWVTVDGMEVMYVNGPNVTLQPRIEKYSTYRNIAEEAAVTSSVSSANPKHLNDGLLSHLKNGSTNVNNAVGETMLSGITTFTFTFDEARTVTSIMVYNSRLEAQIFRQIEQIKLRCLENGKVVDKYINAVPFNSEYYTTNSHGEVTYVEPCSAAYAIFDEQQVLSVEITVSVPDGQTYVGISEVRILGK